MKKLSPFVLDKRCKTCFERSYNHLFKKFDVNASQQSIFKVYFEEVFHDNPTLSAPEIQSLLNGFFCQLIATEDPFEQEKTDSNRLALNLYKEWKSKVLQAKDPFDMALRLSVAGNVMDYGAANQFDVRQTIDKVLQASFAINHVKKLQQAIEKAKKIVYLGDNAGVIVSDKLFLEIINHPQIVYVVKASPVLNDVTYDDAKAVGMDKVASILSNGDNIPSTLLHRVSPEFLEHYRTADVIISKGQGNLEGLIGEKDTRIYFLLMAKCDVIAELLKVEKGSFIVCNQKK